MCSGGSIIADFIPRHRSRRLTASELWPNTFGNKQNDLQFNYSYDVEHQQSASHKRSQEPSQGKALYTFAHSFSFSPFWGAQIREEEKKNMKI